MDTIVSSTAYPSAFDYSQLYDTTEYSEQPPSPPKKFQYPIEPKSDEEKYNQKMSFFTKLIKSKKQAIVDEQKRLYEEDYSKWVAKCRSIDSDYSNQMKKYEEAYAEWQKKANDFYAKQLESNSEVDDLINEVNLLKPSAIETILRISLMEISLPFDYDRDFEICFNEETKMMLIEMTLPLQKDIPNEKSATFVKSRQDMKYSYLSESYMKKKYESVIYQLVLQTINYAFNLENLQRTVQSVILNGRVSTIDKATGNSINPCILSINVSRNDFEELNLSAIDSKAWFRGAKGISAASLAVITPVAPIVELKKDDSRFIEAYEVGDKLDDGYNIAAMDWQDFENLIREVFEKEFGSNGEEVKITQASRDGGVDAVAFDPDPIRGGKIVIQAKRYTNVVGVSAVRDLYGTVMNEGAIKGILVTTAHYGNDAYEFAKGKPLTLMNGANLLYLLEKNGYKAKIDIAEAKRMQKK